MVGLAQSYSQCALWRALNGVGLAVVVPAVQSFIADSYVNEERGWAFGWLNLVGSTGAILGAMSATVLADPKGHQAASARGGGSGASAGAGGNSSIPSHGRASQMDPLLSSSVATEAGSTHMRLQKHRPSSLMAELKEQWNAVKSVIGLRTFQVVILQGVIGSVPWQAMVFFTMWLQLIGFSHNAAAFLMAIFSVGCAGGALLGGWLGDQAARRLPNAGRILCAQFSAFAGIPFSWVLLLLLPIDPTYWQLYAITLLTGGLLISWCQACANNPIFAEVVPVHLRTSIYALDRAFEGGLAAMAAPAVGLLAERVFGYRSDMIIPENGSPVEARALGKGLFTLMAFPWAICCLSYGLLFVTYKNDKDQVRNKVGVLEIPVVNNNADEKFFV
eukprot:TRINITY_DN3257_c1_g1_i1.p1 TRINITY_DN3257_c1_g1~~TRINITY_DN3257_c1_g1_i1.p1  ORF type:complete len:399 (+),score=62.68 TRINITY_DN3257_c1_g1_i1:33-1199(+)